MKNKRRYNTIKNILDLMEPITDVLLILICFALPFILNFESMGSQVKNTNLTPIDMLVYTIFKYGNLAIAICASVFCLYKIREKNKKKVINRSNNYHKHKYFTYYICAKLLNYEACKLSKMPIPMAFKLVVRNTFNKYLYLDDIHEPEKDKVITRFFIGSKQQKYNKKLKETTKSINLILSDTHNIDVKKHVVDILPDDKRNMISIELESVNSNDGLRVKSLELIKHTMKVLNDFNNIEELNIFATTNPYNTYKIACECFSLVKRKKIEHLYVYYQDPASDEWKFSLNKETIF